MSKKLLYYSIKVVQIHESSPYPGLPYASSPKLFVGSHKTNHPKYETIVGDGGLDDWFDYIEYAIDIATFKQPENFSSSYISISHPHAPKVRKWWSTYVNDDFIIPEEYRIPTTNAKTLDQLKNDVAKIISGIEHIFEDKLLKKYPHLTLLSDIKGAIDAGSNIGDMLGKTLIDAFSLFDSGATNEDFDRFFNDASKKILFTWSKELGKLKSKNFGWLYDMVFDIDSNSNANFELIAMYENEIIDRKNSKASSAFIGEGIRDFVGGNGMDTIISFKMNGNIFAGDGNDIIYLIGGSPFVDPGEGRNVILSLNSKASVDLSKGSNKLVLIGDKMELNLIGVGTDDEIYYFKDYEIGGRKISFDIFGGAGQLSRLYQASFGRPHDEEGLGYWLKHMQNGMSLSEIASYFIQSDEFKSFYGTNTSNAQFLEQLYTKILGRQPDVGGFKYWHNILDIGFPRNEILVLFSESAENISITMPNYEFGIWFV